MNTKKLETILQNRNQAEFKKAIQSKEDQNQGFSKETATKLVFKEPANEAVPQNKDQSQRRKYFGLLDEHHIPPSLKFILKSGNRFYQPYAGISFIDYNVENGLSIYTGKRKITLQGRNLETLADYISNYAVDWIKESNTNRDDGKTEIYISSIKSYAE